MEKDEKIVLENARYDHWRSSFGCGPCGFGQGAIDKACAKAGDVYVYYRHEYRGATTYEVYSAEGVPPIETSESIERHSRLESYASLAEARKSPYRLAFEALRVFVKVSIEARKAKRRRV